MTDVIDVIGQRIAQDAVYQPYPGGGGYGGGTFSRDRSDLRIEFEEITYGNLYPFESKPVIVEKSSYVNDTSLADKQAFSVNKKTSSSFTYTLKEGLSTKFKIGAKIPFFGGTQTEVTINFESTQAQTKADEQQWSYSTDINIAPHKKVVSSFIVNEDHYNVPFTARLRVRGLACVAFPMHYPHYSWETFYWKHEISELISKLGWNPALFAYDLLGTFEAVYGASYDVRVDESDLGKIDTVTEGKNVEQTGPRPDGTSLIIDSGSLRNDKIHSHVGWTSTIEEVVAK
jgi:Clostridium epsilon toxin ETX/Bacillus mosquitocidal toxin MTX2